jgi:hypothetical protein
MPDMGSRPIRQTVLYAQDTQPDDTRDGVLWVDTSDSSRPVYVYSSDTGAWEPAAPDAVHRQDTQPTGATDGDLWVDTGVQPRVVYAYDAGADSWDRVGQKLGQESSTLSGSVGSNVLPLTITVSFTNTYSTAGGGSGITITDTYAADAFGGGFKRFTTDANGNVDGMEMVVANNDSGSRSYEGGWNVMGVLG